jgi:hypothetical protein
MQHPDATEQDISGPEGCRFSFDLGFDLTFQEEICFLEGMVVDLGSTAWLIIDHEHCEQFCT